MRVSNESLGEIPRSAALRHSRWRPGNSWRALPHRRGPSGDYPSDESGTDDHDVGFMQNRGAFPPTMFVARTSYTRARRPCGRGAVRATAQVPGESDQAENRAHRRRTRRHRPSVPCGRWEVPAIRLRPGRLVLWPPHGFRGRVACGREPGTAALLRAGPGLRSVHGVDEDESDDRGAMPTDPR